MEWNSERNDLGLKYIIEMSKTRKKYSAGHKNYSAGRTPRKSPNESEYYTPEGSLDSGYHTAVEMPRKEKSSKKKEKLRKKQEILEKIIDDKKTDIVPSAKRISRRHRENLTPEMSPTSSAGIEVLESQFPPLPSPPKIRKASPKSDSLNYSQIQTESYSPEEIPTFWLPIFTGSELLDIRTQIQKIVSSDLKSNGMPEMCSIVKSLVSTYTNPPENRTYNIMNCAVFLLMGIISAKLDNQKYNMILKGGKAVQLLLSQMRSRDQYYSEDVDILLIPNNGVYHLEEMQILASHIALLINWFLAETTLPVFLKIPSNTDINPYVTKISFKNSATNQFKVVSDIDIKPIPEFMLHHYLNRLNYVTVHRKVMKIFISEPYVLYRSLALNPHLDEKIYYFVLYYTAIIQKRNRIAIEDPDIDKLPESTLRYYLDKFRRSIVALTRAMHHSNLERQYQFLQNHVLIRNNPYRNEIVDSILHV